VLSHAFAPWGDVSWWAVLLCSFCGGCASSMMVCGARHGRVRFSACHLARTIIGAIVPRVRYQRRRITRAYAHSRWHAHQPSSLCMTLRCAVLCLSHWFSFWRWHRGASAESGVKLRRAYALRACAHRARAAALSPRRCISCARCRHEYRLRMVYHNMGHV